jgi:hypothetical protein
MTRALKPLGHHFVDFKSMSRRVIYNHTLKCGRQLLRINWHLVHSARKLNARHHYPVVKDRCRELEALEAFAVGAVPPRRSWILATGPRGVNPCRKNFFSRRKRRKNVAHAPMREQPLNYLPKKKQTRLFQSGFSWLHKEGLQRKTNGSYLGAPGGSASTTIP